MATVFEFTTYGIDMATNGTSYIVNDAPRIVLDDSSTDTYSTHCAPSSRPPT